MEERNWREDEGTRQGGMFEKREEGRGKIKGRYWTIRKRRRRRRRRRRK